MPLQLEYTWTEKDFKEAKDIGERESFGGGPKWRSTLVMWLVLGFLLIGVSIRFVTEVSSKDRLWFIALVGVVFGLFQYLKRKTRAKIGDPVRLEISERAIVLEVQNNRTE